MAAVRLSFDCDAIASASFARLLQWQNWVVTRCFAVAFGRARGRFLRRGGKRALWEVPLRAFCRPTDGGHLQNGPPSDRR